MLDLDTWPGQMGLNFFHLLFPIRTVPEIMGPYFGRAPGRRTSCPGPEPALIEGEEEGGGSRERRKGIVFRRGRRRG